MPTIQHSNEYEGTLPPNLPGGFISMRLSASDLAGNVLDYQMEPALFLGTVVPIQLSSFTAEVLSTPHTVRLEWTTLSEINNYGFEVQKASDVAGAYGSLPNGFVPGHGTTVEPQRYSFIDSMSGSQLVYYRIQQIDLDGAVHYTDPIQVNVATGVDQSILPAVFFSGTELSEPVQSDDDHSIFGSRG